MVVLSIDPGFDKLGFAFFDKKSGTEFTYLSSGLIKTDRKALHQFRLEKIYSQLQSLIEINHPEIIVIEELFFSRNVTTAIKVAQAQGVVILLAAQAGIPIQMLNPMQIKQIITGYGNADKKAVAKMLSLLMKDGLPKCEDDQSDAIACGYAYCYLNQNLL